MNPQQTWKKILEEIKSEISYPNYRAFFAKTDVETLNEEEIIILVPSSFIEENLRIKNLQLIENMVEKVVNKKLKVSFKVDFGRFFKKGEEEEEFELSPSSFKPQASPLNPKFKLENFVVGLSNNVAFAAAQAVVQNPGTSYNRLFLYGGTGVGKTHLMLGVGNALLSKNPNLKIIYCSSEKFMNDYVEAIQTHKMGDLRNKYRSADLLLVDDIQFFSGREGTQEEFFHTFNELQTKNSQMILTSDKPPHEIAKLEDRLRSRFAGGLMIDIQPPDFDTRVAILKAKCQERGEELPEDILRLIASSVESNIRELEGKLVQILQTLKASNLPPTEENITGFFRSIPKKSVSQDPKMVLNTICSYFNLNLKDMTGPKRQKELVLPRHITMYILSEELNLTVEKIGQILGGRDHTTVMHGRDRIKKLLNTDREIQKTFIEIKQRLS